MSSSPRGRAKVESDLVIEMPRNGKLLKQNTKFITVHQGAHFFLVYHRLNKAFVKLNIN